MNARGAKLYIVKQKEGIPQLLFPLIHQSLKSAFVQSSTFYIALSGGSLPSLLTGLPKSFQDAGIDPKWHQWHVLLADERVVPLSHDDSNMKALKDCFLDQVPIPETQIYGIDESLFDTDVSRAQVDQIASEYQRRVFPPSTSSDEYRVDCALLGFGPDGHTASLFPHHSLLVEDEVLVAGIMDSPKPPPERITLTMKVFNQMCSDIIFVGAGESKSPILNDIFSSVTLLNETDSSSICEAYLKDRIDQTFPCGMIYPEKKGRLTYITDEHGAKDLDIKLSSS